jgi:hypothetical protein
VRLPISPQMADVAGAPTAWIERYVRAVGEPLQGSGPAASPSPASPDDVAGLIADAKLLRDAVHEYNRGAHGLDTHESELWAIADRIENAAASAATMREALNRAHNFIANTPFDSEALEEATNIDNEIVAALRERIIK